ncbi:hypothetical protein NQ318_004914 [Aromia moschata]|uniref:C2H2-type domain-containing protein n=1 Tax=Aromia moschata TaxID=1265417 RepID=A0AAV8Z1C2_9CUCU|nr:hypothetical protein NQ318_004914 [Aromia moschata]
MRLVQITDINYGEKSPQSLMEPFSSGSSDETPSPKLSDVSPDILLAKTIYYNSQNATLTSQETCEPQDNESSISSLNHQKVSCVENLNTKSIIMKEKRQGSEFGAKPSAPKESVSNNVDSILNNFGSIIKDDKTLDKKNCCPYCFLEVTHFPRHLQRNHEDEGAVREILLLPKDNPKRKILLNSLRRQGNYALNAEKIRPVRRPRTVKENEEYFTCNYCLGFFKKMYLRKHRKKCAMNNCPQRKRENHLSESQAFIICSGIYKDFYDSLRLKTEVLDKMRVDEVSKTVIGDILICSYGESQLNRHKRVQLATMVSNKLRELGRLVIVLKEMTGLQRLLDVLKPEFFDNLVTATKVVSGYDNSNKSFKAPSLALHMRTRLIQICDIAAKMIIKKNRFLECNDPEVALKNIKRLRALISAHWNSELSSLALKDLNEKQWEKPKMFSLTSELMQFQKYVLCEANIACENIKSRKKPLDIDFRKLSECVMALTLLLNRKRIGEIQFLKLKTYKIDRVSNQQKDFLDSLTEKRENFDSKFQKGFNRWERE